MDNTNLSNQIAQLIVAGITSGCIYAIVAIGFSIIYNSTGVINFAQGEFVMIGAMVYAVLANSLNLWLAIPAATLCGCFAGAIIGLFILLSLKRASAVSLIIITIGASIMLRGLAQLFWGESAIPAAPFTGIVIDGSLEDRSYQFLGAAIRAQEVWVMAITACLVAAMHLFFHKTLIGKAMRACAMNPIGAKIVGINVNRMILLSFVMAAGLGAVSGLAMAPVFYARCTMGTAMGLKGFCAAILGGLGKFGGGIVAGVTLGIVEALAGGLLSSDYKEAVAFVILVLILCIKPEGLFAIKGKRKV